MSKFKLAQTAAEVQGILNNSLQKPTGLTKTKLVGVGVNGQENIEIGDNLTLANGKLSASGGGGGGSVLHCYSIYPGQTETFYYNVYISEDFEEFKVDKSSYINITDAKYKPLRKSNYAKMPTAGYYIDGNGTAIICSYVAIEPGNNSRYQIHGCDIESKQSYVGYLVHDYVNVIKRY